ncbi:MAG TPA: hypothetical protein VGR57_04385 [Ktedonobacterales bacterium]|nr:hypothetical protein [Ktedonobacterales bacterium]
MADERVFPEQTALRAAIGGLYATFASYPLKRVIVGCPHCVSRADSGTLHIRALDALTADDVRFYAFKAMTTFGDEEDFKHFLPRLLELLAREVEAGGAEEDLGFDEEVLGGKLAMAGYSDWPAVEREAVERFLDAMWAVLLARFPTKLEAETFLCFLAQFTTLDRYLALWRATRTRSALAHVAVAVYEPFCSSFWPALARKRFENWLAESETFAMVQLAADAWRDGAYRGEFPTWVEMTLSYLSED